MRKKDHDRDAAPNLNSRPDDVGAAPGVRLKIKTQKQIPYRERGVLALQGAWSRTAGPEVV